MLSPYERFAKSSMLNKISGHYHTNGCHGVDIIGACSVTNGGSGGRAVVLSSEK